MSGQQPTIARRAVAWAAVLAVAVPGPVVAGSAMSVTAAAAATSCPAPGGATMPAPPSLDNDLVVTGGGLGHGLGMSQYGAQGAARLGCSATQILKTYYSQSHIENLAATMPSEVRLWMLQNGTHADVLAMTGTVRWTVPGCTTDCPPVQPKGARWRVATDVTKSRLQLLDRMTGQVLWQGAPGKGLTASHRGTVITVESYQGPKLYLRRQLRWDETRYTVDASGLDAIQSIKTSGGVPAMDRYLWGLGEVPISWTNGAHEALRAQVIAARTYALAKLRAGTVLLPTPVHQNYTGYQKEAADEAYRDTSGRNLRWRDAVTSTSGQALVAQDGKLVGTFYSSSFGGHSEDVRYVWGSSSISYLRGIDDSRWDAASDGATYRSWARGFTRAEAAGRLGLDSLTSIKVPGRGTAARVDGVTVTGVKGGQQVTKTYTGWNFKSAMGLPSTNFRVTLRPAPPTSSPSEPSSPSGPSSPSAKKAVKAALATSVSQVGYGGTVKLTGTVGTTDGKSVRGAAVALQARPLATRAWKTVANGKTSAKGQVSFTRAATAAAEYRLRVSAGTAHLGGVSAVRAVRVNRSTSVAFSRSAVKRGRGVVLSGKVAPAASGVVVERQQYVGGRWVTVATARTTGKGRFSMVVKPRYAGRYTYRVAVRGAGAYGAGRSGTVRLSVTR